MQSAGVSTTLSMVKSAGEFSTVTSSNVLKQPLLLSGHYIAHQKLKAWQGRTRADDIIITSVGRLTAQKVLLLTQPFQNSLALEQMLDSLGDRGIFLMTGSGDSELESVMTQIMAKRDNFIFLQGYDELLARELYRSGDLFMMPSSFEPCLFCFC